MPITSRNRAIAFFIVLGACSVALALALNITWLIHWRQIGMVVLGILFFGFIIAGVTLNTIFLVREMRRSEQHDSFINAVTHELKTPIASIRLYLETLQSRNLSDAQRKRFYGIMLEDTDRLINTVEKVLRAGHLGQKSAKELPAPRPGRTHARMRIAGPDPPPPLAGKHPLCQLHALAAIRAGRSRRAAFGHRQPAEGPVKSSPGKIGITVEILDEAGNLLVRVNDKGQGTRKANSSGSSAASIASTSGCASA